MSLTFKLDDNFVNQYTTKKVKFGFNGVGEVLYKRSYSRLKEDGTNEEWYETIRRVVEGVYDIQKKHITRMRLFWNDDKAQKSAQEMYERMFTMKLLPPGRGLFAMGTPIVHEKELGAALYNCAFVSTVDLANEFSKPFRFLMDMSMCGIGVGFDTKGAGTIDIKSPTFTNEIYTIEDSREGWVNSTAIIIDGYFSGLNIPVFNYDEIRPEGAPIKTFGGTAPGPGPLRKLHNQIIESLSREIGKPISSKVITDLMNMIGCCVVSGNIRRSAEIAFGEYDDEVFPEIKNYALYPEREAFGWASNNSIFVPVGADYSRFIDKTVNNGEPGYVWLENCKEYGRTGYPKDYKDSQVAGLNPCSEIPLESYELCNLAEVYPGNHETKEDFLRTLKYSYLYTKAVSLLPIHWPESNEVKLRNLRLGNSQSGIVQAVEKLGLGKYKDWCEDGYKTLDYYDGIYSGWLKVPRSIRLTTVKPSGSVSLLAGTTPGCHWPEALHYIRRMRLPTNSELVNQLIKAGYTTEPDVQQPDSTMVVEFPVKVDCKRTQKDVSIWEKAELARFMQMYWSDNAVSVTVDFGPEEAQYIQPILEHMQYDLKAISFLPRMETGAYPQMPYETITTEKYDSMLANLKEVELEIHNSDGIDNKFCDGDKCVI